MTSVCCLLSAASRSLQSSACQIVLGWAKEEVPNATDPTTKQRSLTYHATTDLLFSNKYEELIHNCCTGTTHCGLQKHALMVRSTAFCSTHACAESSAQGDKCRNNAGEH
jgi:hypothetical protein